MIGRPSELHHASADSRLIAWKAILNINGTDHDMGTPRVHLRDKDAVWAALDQSDRDNKA
jgi:hypothetical protein